ncbi:NfeD family protein [Aliikangiella maris]|uniref:NfeD family protein n=2 Tax=Aliikangiella maris TaxID=3162458 RepID=A0ABV2BY44_9GAMM
MTEYITQHMAEFWLVLGFVLLAIEVITGFVSGIFLFAGLGGVLTGGLMSFGILPETWIAGFAGTGINSGLLTVALWKPFKKLQNNEPVAKDNSSDIIGYQFVLKETISSTDSVVTSYSGINWRVEIDPAFNIQSINKGQRVEVTSVEVGLFKVKPI